MNHHGTRLILTASLISLFGFVFSGPVAFIIVNLVAPQPQWENPQVFAEHYRTIQDIPFYFGFFLIGGMLLLSAAYYFNYLAHDILKFRLLISFGITTIFCSLISFNYICQTTFLHNLALHYSSGNDASISAFSMTNPLSFCWANEMWGYAFLGIATMLMAGYYKNQNEFIRWLMLINGIMSVWSAVWTIINVNWVMTTAGLVAYFFWNLIMIVMMIAIARHAKLKMRESEKEIVKNF